MCNLDDLEVLGLKIVAYLRDGQLDQFKDCNLCRQNGNDKCLEGREFEHPKIGKFNSCPILFLSSSVTEFMKEYDYLEKYPAAAPSYSDVNPKYLMALNKYEQIKYEIEKAKLSKDTSKPSSNESSLMSKMTALTKKRE